MQEHGNHAQCHAQCQGQLVGNLGVTHLCLLGVHLLPSLQPRLDPLHHFGAAHGLRGPGPDLIDRFCMHGDMARSCYPVHVTLLEHLPIMHCMTHLGNVFYPCSTAPSQSSLRKYAASATSLVHLNPARRSPRRLFLRSETGVLRRVHHASIVYRVMQFDRPKNHLRSVGVCGLENDPICSSLVITSIIMTVLLKSGCLMCTLLDLI